jgi:hypothetical protein
LKIVNIQITHSKKLKTPKACMDRINRIRARKFLSCSTICFCSGSCLYFSCKVRIRLAIERNLFVYASIKREIAGNNKAGVVIDNSIAPKIVQTSWFRAKNKGPRQLAGDLVNPIN